MPARAILLSVSVGFLSVIFNAVSPDKAFLFLVNASGAVALFVYLLICVAELKMRRRLASVGLVKETRSQLIPSPISLAVVLGAAWYVHGRRGGRPQTESAPAGNRGAL